MHEDIAVRVEVEHGRERSLSREDDAIGDAKVARDFLITLRVRTDTDHGKNRLRFGGKNVLGEDANEAILCFFAGVATRTQETRTVFDAMLREQRQEGIFADRAIKVLRRHRARHHVNGRGHAASEPVIAKALGENDEAIGVVEEAGVRRLVRLRKRGEHSLMNRRNARERFGKKDFVSHRQVRGVDANHGRTVHLAKPERELEERRGRLREDQIEVETFRVIDPRLGRKGKVHARVGRERKTRELNRSLGDIADGSVRILWTYKCDLVTTPTQRAIQEPCLKHRTVRIRNSREVADDGDFQRSTGACGEFGKRRNLGHCLKQFPMRVNSAAKKRVLFAIERGFRGMSHRVKLVDLTEFYSERGGGVRSHLDAKNQVACQLGHESVVIAPGPRNERIDFPSSGLKGGSRSVVRLAGPSTPYDPTYHLLTAPRALRKAIEAERPDVLELHSPYLASFFGMRVPREFAKVRTFVWHADFIDTYLRPALEKRVSRAFTDRAVEPLWAWVRSISRSVNGTFVASRSQKAKLLDHGCERVILVPFGVDREVFHTRISRDENLRNELLEGRREPLLIAVGRFAVEKRWDVLIDIAERAYAQKPFTLWLFGDGPERPLLEAAAKRLPFLRVGGFEKSRERLAAIYRAADGIVHSCPYETFGLGLAEAVACGAPIVVPDEGGAFEQAREGSSFTYRSLDAAAGARAVLELLDEPARELRSYAVDNAADVPGFDTYMRRMLSYYEDFARGPKP